jgi:hypothetical protein
MARVKIVDESKAPGGSADLAAAQRLIDARAGEALLTTRHLAALLNKAVPTIRDWRTRRIGPPYIRRGTALYRWADVQSWLAGGVVTPGAAA